MWQEAVVACCEIGHGICLEGMKEIRQSGQPVTERGFEPESFETRNSDRDLWFFVENKLFFL